MQKHLKAKSWDVDLRMVSSDAKYEKGLRARVRCALQKKALDRFVCRLLRRSGESQSISRWGDLVSAI
jgi:hypothetical protein